MHARNRASLVVLIFIALFVLTPAATVGGGDEPTDDVLLIIVGCIVDSQDFGEVEVETGVETRCLKQEPDIGIRYRTLFHGTLINADER